jgi:hypothetical protein
MTSMLSSKRKKEKIAPLDESLVSLSETLSDLASVGLLSIL